MYCGSICSLTHIIKERRGPFCIRAWHSFKSLLFGQMYCVLVCEVIVAIGSFLSMPFSYNWLFYSFLFSFYFNYATYIFICHYSPPSNHTIRLYSVKHYPTVLFYCIIISVKITKYICIHERLLYFENIFKKSFYDTIFSKFKR